MANGGGYVGGLFLMLFYRIKRGHRALISTQPTPVWFTREEQGCLESFSDVPFLSVSSLRAAAAYSTPQPVGAQQTSLQD